MVNLTIKDPETPKEPTVELGIRKKNNGDVVLWANGWQLIRINAQTGTFSRMCLAQGCGLNTDDLGRIIEEAEQ